MSLSTVPNHKKTVRVGRGVGVRLLEWGRLFTKTYSKGAFIKIGALIYKNIFEWGRLLEAKKGAKSNHCGKPPQHADILDLKRDIIQTST